MRFYHFLPYDFGGIHLTDLGMMPWDDLLEPVLRRLTNQ